MKKNLFLRLCLMTIALLSLNSCRQEDLYEQGTKPQGKDQYKVYMMNRKQITSDFALFDKVARLQNLFTERKNLNARSVQDSVLDGGVVKIDKVLVVENQSGQKTYTFPLKRTFSTSTIENLVLKRNTDSTFSGVLLQYDLSAREKDLFNNWHSVDLKSKTKIYDINNLSIATTARVQSAYFGCFVMSYEDGLCASTQHGYGDTSCDYLTNGQTQNQAQPPRILSITSLPGCGNGGDLGSTNTPPPDTGFSPGGGDTNTMMFDDYDLTYHNGDITDPDFQFWYKVNQFIQAQPQNVQSLNAEYHYVFYFIHTYFKLNGGLTDANKIFVADRLQKIATWYYDPTTGNHLDYEQKKSIAIWSVKHLLENPDLSWEDYKNQFLDYTNIKIDSSLTNTKTKCVLQKMSGDINLGDNKITLTADATNDNLFQKMLRKFDGNNMPSLNFEIKSSLQVNEWGITKGTNSNSYNIIINQDIENQSNLLKTVILSHELIHAFMFCNLPQKLDHLKL
ncbi:hypothetical protein [Chryseobacterium sp. RR2-3-20]|uniref:hypothetical protein n=1 Tax=Chryseobacterium sp. RR2-3-20 TaxID=2787626 RepID=UPI001AE01528|nr:hypothetical protein [Chryseobacterium sp. RR2-3-20]